jgi:hypothetical protein
MSRKFTRVCRFAGLVVPAVLALGASAACASNVGVDFNLHLGNQPQQVVVPQPVAVAPAPPVVIDQDVDFVYPDNLGFYVAVGVPYDLFYVRDTYYVYRDGSWLRSARRGGPWMVMQRRDLPPGIRRQKLARIRAFRDAEYDVYRHDRDHYHGRHFHTGKEEWKEARREEKERRKEEKHEAKEERRMHRHGGRDDD